MTEFDRFCQVIARLRAEDGCPWDKVQTHSSLKPEVIEEAAEVVCGINILEQTNDPDNLKEELGDLLMQVVMHAQIAKEEGLFTIEDVIDGITRKMIRRHPHVFHEESETYREGTPMTWEEIKNLEKTGKEWMQDYLPGALDESSALIQRAKERKGYK